MLPSESNYYIHRLRAFSQELINAVELTAIIRILREHVNTSLLPGWMVVYIYDGINHQYVAAPGEDGLPTSKICFHETSSLVQTLRTAEMPVFSNDIILPPESNPDQAQLALLGALLVVPFLGSERPVGWLALAERRSGEAYSAQDLDFLNQVGCLTAIAITHVQRSRDLQTANEAKSEFVSLVAHELKNPMTSIMGYTDMLSRGTAGPVTEMQANFLGTIHSNVQRMSILVSELNDHSEIEANRLRLEFKAVDTAEVVDEVMRSIKRQMDERKQTGRVNLPPGLPEVLADRTRLAQIITNLVSNANKYTPEGGVVTVGAEKSTNHWDPDGAADVVHLWVQDNGIGISPEDQKKIFQKFFRSDDSKAHEAPGTGLGLSITKSLIEMMGGHIWIESEFRKGTTFHFTVPVAEA